MTRSKTRAAMPSKVMMLGLSAWIGLMIPAMLQAQSSTTVSGKTNSAPPDLSGVYFPILREDSGRSGLSAPAGEAPPRPTQTSPFGDGRQGRNGAPSLTPDYMAKWEVIRKTRVAGSSEYDNFAKCVPLGIPSMMLSNYPMEVLQSRDKIIFINELNDSIRRIYLDSRKATQKHLDDPTYAGYSTGSWDGDTLLVDTVAVHTNAIIESISVVFTPHSEAMTVRERIRFAGPGLLEDKITVIDPEAFTKPWETVQRFRKAKPGSGRDELREFACAEGFGVTK